MKYNSGLDATMALTKWLRTQMQTGLWNDFAAFGGVRCIGERERPRKKRDKRPYLLVKFAGDVPSTVARVAAARDLTVEVMIVTTVLLPQPLPPSPLAESPNLPTPMTASACGLSEEQIAVLDGLHAKLASGLNQLLRESREVLVDELGLYRPMIIGLTEQTRESEKQLSHFAPERLTFVYSRRPTIDRTD